MEEAKRRKISEEEINKVFDEILNEDRRENLDSDSLKPWAEDCLENEDKNEKKTCECIRMAENSSRLSLRVMEAMRSLQRQDELLPTSSIEDIVTYIQANYHDDGDLYAQVRTSLKQVCSQGFVLEMLEDEYHLIGPTAISMNRISCSRDRDDYFLSSTKKIKERNNKTTDERNISRSQCQNCEKSVGRKWMKPRRTFTIKDRSPFRGSRDRQRTSREDTGSSATLNEEDASEGISECSCNSISPRESVENVSETARQGEGSRNRREEIGEPEGNRVDDSGESIWSRFKKNFQGRRTSNRQMNGKGVSVEGGTRREALNLSRARDRRREEENEELNERPESVDDIYETTFRGGDRTRTDERERELKRWIKRCQKECEERGRER